MGLCTSKTSVSLNPAAHILHAEREDRNSPEGTPVLEEGVLLVQPAKSKNEGGGGGGSKGARGGGGGAQPAKGYLELGGKAGEGETHTSREADQEEEEEQEEQDAVEEMVNFSHSEVSLQSEFLELS